MKVKEIMVSDPYVAKESDTLKDIALLMIEKRIGCLPVVDNDGKLVGIITEADFTAHEHGIPFSRTTAPQLFGKWIPKEGVEKAYKLARTITAKEIMSAPVITTNEDDEIEKLITKMCDRDLTRIPVVHDDKPVGIVSKHDLLKILLDD